MRWYKNSFEHENHYYIYKNSYTNAKVMEATGIKSRSTIIAAYKKLLEVGALETHPYHEDAYIIRTTRLYVPMNVAVLRFLLAFNTYLDPSLLITTFAILARMSKLEKGKPIDFTRATLAGLLGLAKQNVDSAGITLILAVLEHAQLIQLVKVPYKNQLKVDCIRYSLIKVDTEGHGVVGLLNDTQEFEGADIKKLWTRILEVEPD